MTFEDASRQCGLIAILRGITPAEELLEKFHGPWNGSVDPVYDDYAY